MDAKNSMGRMGSEADEGLMLEFIGFLLWKKNKKKDCSGLLQSHFLSLVPKRGLEPPPGNPD